MNRSKELGNSAMEMNIKKLESRMAEYGDKMPAEAKQKLEDYIHDLKICLFATTKFKTVAFYLALQPIFLTMTKDPKLVIELTQQLMVDQMVAKGFVEGS